MKNLIFNLKNSQTLAPTKRKKHRNSNSRAAWQVWPHAAVSPPFPRHFPCKGGFSHGISLLPISWWGCPFILQNTGLSLFSFSWHLPLQWHLTPGLPSAGQQHPMTFLGPLLRALSHHLGGMGHYSPQQAGQKQCQGLFIGRGPQFLAYTIIGFLCKKGGKRICSTSVLQFKVTAICIMPERQRIEEKENIRMLFLLFPNILGYKDQTNYQTVLSWAGFTNHTLLEELGENLLSRIMKGANKLFSWRVNIIKKIIFYVIFFSSLLIAAWNTFLKYNELQMNSWAINLLYMALEGKLIRWVDAITAIT